MVKIEFYHTKKLEVIIVIMSVLLILKRDMIVIWGWRKHSNFRVWSILYF